MESTEQKRILDDMLRRPVESCPEKLTRRSHDAKKKLYRVATARQKTGTPVSVPLPQKIAAEVLAVLNGNPRYVFWTGSGLETFRRGLLQKGIPSEEVSKLLGHTSIKTTEKSYAPCVMQLTLVGWLSAHLGAYMHSLDSRRMSRMSGGISAHLTSKDDVKCCSKCGKEFPEDSKPSISKAFAAHVREEHQRVPPVQSPTQRKDKKTA